MMEKWNLETSVGQISWYLSNLREENPEKTSTKKFTRPGIEPGPGAYVIRNKGLNKTRVYNLR